MRLSYQQLVVENRIFVDASGLRPIVSETGPPAFVCNRDDGDRLGEFSVDQIRKLTSLDPPLWWIAVGAAEVR